MTMTLASMRLLGLTAQANADPETVPLSDLVILPPTDVLRQRLVEIEQQAGDPDSMVVKAARNTVRLAEHRDRLQAARPEGCWCLSTGGRGMIPLAMRVTLPNGAASWCMVPMEVVTGFSDYCRCPDGERVWRASRAAVDAYQLQHRQTVLARRWRRAGLPAYTDGLTIESFSVSDENAEAVAKLAA